VITRSRVACGLLGALAAAAAACATAPGSGGPPGTLAVEVLGGQPSLPEWLPATTPRVEIVLDATPSMTRARVDGIRGFEAARAAAARTLDDLPADTRATFHLVGGPDRSESCTDELGALVSEPGPPVVLADDARGAPRRGEASLPDALGRLADTLEASGETPRARIVVFTDLAQDCGGDLCAATTRLVAGGASFDWVLVGDEPLPSCLEDVALDAAPPRPLAAQPLPTPPRFSVIPRDAMLVGGETAARARVEGVADGTAIGVPSGLAFVGIDLSPPANFGPVAIEAGGHYRVRVVEFPSASPPAREWQIDPVAGGPAPAAAGDPAQ